jgi:hypothetical protein
MMQRETRAARWRFALERSAAARWGVALERSAAARWRFALEWILILTRGASQRPLMRLWN